MVLAVAVAAAIVVATQRTEGPKHKGPSTASTVEVSRLADQCRRLHRLSDDVRRLRGGAAARRLVVECARLNRLLALSAREREVVRSGRFPADELPPGLRELLVRRHLDLDRVHSVECGVGRQAPVKLRPSLEQLVMARPPRSRSAVEKVAGDMARAVTNICLTELRPSGIVNVSARVGDEWVQIAARAAVAGAL